ncbi:MAG: hypothetical protein AAF750_13665 [Planctomycetota bacterium]
MDRSAVTDRDFLDARASLLDLAAFLDRVDRSEGQDDFRVAALRTATTLLDDGQAERARRILEHLSDPTAAPIDRAPMKGAAGAYNPEPA